MNINEVARRVRAASISIIGSVNYLHKLYMYIKSTDFERRKSDIMRVIKYIIDWLRFNVFCPCSDGICSNLVG